MKILLLAGCCFLSHIAAAQPVSQLDSLFLNWKAEEPGGIVWVQKDGKTLYKKSFGLADVTRHQPNGSLRLYDLASNAKQFTAMTIALLEERGSISLEDDLKKFYPALRISQPIKIRHLLSHSSGLREASVLAILSGKMNLKGEVRNKFNTLDYYLTCLMKETDLNFIPGDETSYTNFNYVLLADIVAKVSGKSFPQFCDSAIFKPLGMTNTVFRIYRQQSFPNEAKGYLWMGRKFKSASGRGGIVGDHNLLSTIEDLAKWQQNFYHNQLGKKTQELVERITTPFKLNDGSDGHYAFGLWSTSYRGLKQVSHGGDDGRHTSFIVNYPDKKLSIIILANSSRYWDTEEKAVKLADIFLNDEFPEPAAAVAEDSSFITLPEEELAKRTGLYTSVDKKGLASILKIQLDDGKLWVTRNVNTKGLELKPISAEHFVATNPLNYKIHFRFPTDSINVVREQFRSNQPVFFKRAKQLSPDYMSYRGKFRNESTGALIKIKAKRQKIVAKKGIIKIPLIPFDEDKFYAINNDALFTFSRENGTVSSLLVNAWDFRNFRLEKAE